MNFSIVPAISATMLQSPARRRSEFRLELVHVHVCVDCGNACRREEVDSHQLASGIFHSPKCGLEGPLNLEIQDISEVEGNDNDSLGSGSSGQR